MGVGVGGGRSGWIRIRVRLMTLLCPSISVSLSSLPPCPSLFLKDVMEPLLIEDPQGQLAPLTLGEAAFRNTLSLLEDVAEQVQEEQE